MITVTPGTGPDFSDLEVTQVMSVLWEASTVREFLSFTKRELQIVLPHTAFACTLGELRDSGLRPKTVLTVNFPEDAWWKSQLSTGRFFNPFIRTWLATGTTQTRSCSDTGERGHQKLLIKGDLVNVAAYGVRDVSPIYASFFMFHRIPGPLNAKHHTALKLVVPQMHSALVKIFHGGDDVPFARPNIRIAKKGPHLTPRECEVLQWVRLGKTNAEVASILGVSHKTVKNQVQAILIKLRVNNRAQAVASALGRGLLEWSRE